MSAIGFERRVLEEARDARNPLLERVTFLGILGRNLDELVMRGRDWMASPAGRPDSLGACAALRRPSRLAIVRMPEQVSSLVRIDSAGGDTFTWLRQAVLANVHRIFPGARVVASHLFRIVRDADIVVERADADELPERTIEAVRQRDTNPILMMAPICSTRHWRRIFHCVRAARASSPPSGSATSCCIIRSSPSSRSSGSHSMPLPTPWWTRCPRGSCCPTAAIVASCRGRVSHASAASPRCWT